MSGVGESGREGGHGRIDANDPNATSHSSSTSRTHRQSGLYPVVISYSEERNTKTATVTATPTPTPKPAPTATPMPMLATAAPTPAPSTTPTNTLNGKAATPQREILCSLASVFSTDSHNS